MAYANQPGLRPTSFGDAAATDAQVKKLTLTPKQVPVAGNAMQQAFSAAEAGGGRMPTTVQAPNWTIDNARPVNPVQYTGGGQVPQPGNWSTAPGAANTGGLRVVGPGLAERQPIRVPPNASMGTAPRAAPATPNLPATIQGQGPTFQGNGAKPNFTMPDASSPYNAQQAKFDADTVQRARDAATRRAAGGGYAGVNQGSGAGVQGGVGGAQPVARPGTIDLRAGGAGEPGQRAYETSKRLGQGRVGQLIKGAGGALARAGTVGGAIANFNDYKLNDPDVDSSATGTFNALAQGDFSGAGRSLSKGLLETGMDLGSYAANTADIFVPGQPFSQGYNKTLRNHFGDQLTDNSGNNSDAAAPVAPAPANKTKPIVIDTSRRTRSLRDGPGASGEATKGVFGDFSPNGTFDNGYTDMGQGIAGKSTRADGKVNDFTNIGADGKPTALSGVDTRTPDQIANGERIKAETAASLRNPDGSKWSAQDNAIMAANIRDGVDRYRGTSRGAKMSPGQRYAQAAMNAPRTLKNLTVSQMARIQKQATEIDAQSETAANNRLTAETLRRGQDMDLEGRMAPKRMEMELAQRMRQLNAQIYQQSGGNPREAQEIALSMGMDGEAFGKLADANQTRSDKSRQQTRDLLAPAAITKDKDGNDVISPARQAQVEAAVRDAYPDFESLPPAEKAAATQRVLSMENIRAAANDRRDVGLRKAVGFDAPAFEMNTLPEFTGNAEEVGWWEGATTVGAERGDLKVPTKDGTQYLNRGRLTRAELETLKANGAQLRGAN